MLDFEIRFLRGDGRPSLIWKSVHLSDEAAVVTAASHAQGHDFEVWRDEKCVYRPGIEAEPL